MMLLLDRKPTYDTNTIYITKSEFHTNTVPSLTTDVTKNNWQVQKKTKGEEQF